MNPLGQGSAANRTFNNLTQTLGIAAPASQAESALQKKADDARAQAAALLNRGMDARLPKDKIAKFEDARKLNQVALDALLTTELASEKYDAERVETHRQGADIAEQLFNIRKRQAELDPNAQEKKKRQVKALEEADLLEMHLRNADSSVDTRQRISSVVLNKTRIVTAMGWAIRDDADSAEGKERLEMLRSAKECFDQAVRSMREGGLEDSHLEACKESRKLSLDYAATASKDAWLWLEKQWREYLRDAQSQRGGWSLEASYERGLKCMEENEYCREIHQDLFETASEFLEQKGKYRHSEQDVEYIELMKADAHQRILNTSVDRFVQAQFLLDLQLLALRESPDAASEVMRASIKDMADADDLTLGTIMRLRGSDAGEPTQLDHRREILPSVIEFCEDRKQRLDWLSTTCKSNGIVDENLHRELERTAGGAMHLKGVLEKEYEKILASQKPDTERSRQEKRLNLQAQGANAASTSSKRKKKKGSSKTAPSIDTNTAPEQCVIETRFNGKLIGVTRGDRVAVQSNSGRELEFRRDGGKWVRAEEQTADLEDTQAEEMGLPVQRDPAEKARLKASAVVTKARDEIENLKNEASKYCRLSDYSERNDAPFSQSIGIFNLAMSAYQRAISLLDKHLKQIESSAVPQSERAEYREPLQALRTEMENLKRTAKNEKLASIKSNPSGPALEYLMDENEVVAIRKTVTRKALSGPNVPLNKQDFMDEYQPEIKSFGMWPPVHSHYRSKNAPISSAAASHLTTNNGGAKSRLPVSLRLLERLERASI